MKNKMKKLLCTFMCFVISVSCLAVSVSAADADAVLKYKVSDDGFAVVSDCDASATGAVIIPSKVLIKGKSYNVKYIGDRAFDGCYYITVIKIPEGVTAIRNHAFRDCLSLTDVYIPESLIVCQYDAFDGCASVTVHCYRSNYQFFTVFGMSANIDVDVVDGKENSSTSDIENETSDNFIMNFIQALKSMINSIIEYFKSDYDFDFEFPFELPFEIPV